MLVADRFNNRIVMFEIGSPANPYATICQLGTEPGQVSKPYSVYMAPGTSELTVADTMNRRIQIFNIDGLKDTDGDGMPDAWETANGLNPNSPDDAALDPDGDGLTNLQEFQLGTNPQNSDTDGDGLSDGAEVNVFGTDPLDPNSPGAGSFVFSGSPEVPESATEVVTVAVGIAGKAPADSVTFNISGSIPGRVEAVGQTISFPAGVSTAQFSFRPLNGTTSCTFNFTPVPPSTFASGSYSVTVKNVNPTIVSMTASATSGNVGDTFTFTGLATDPSTDVLTYTWYFADGSAPETGTSVSHTYNIAGTHVVRLVVTDPDGGRAEASLPIVIVSPETVDLQMTAITRNSVTFRYPTVFKSNDLVVMASPVMTTNMLLWAEWLPLSQTKLQAGGDFNVTSLSDPVYSVPVSVSANADGYTYVTFDIGAAHSSKAAMFFRAAVKSAAP